MESLVVLKIDIVSLVIVELLVVLVVNSLFV